MFVPSVDLYSEIHANTFRFHIPGLPESFCLDVRTRLSSFGAWPLNITRVFVSEGIGLSLVGSGLETVADDPSNHYLVG
jgi:hypothetical protein